MTIPGKAAQTKVAQKVSALPPNDLLPAGDFPPLPSANLPQITPRRKAAIIVNYVLSNGIQLPLSALPLDLQEALTFELAGMRSVDKSTLDSVVEEFTSEMESVGLSFPAGLPNALQVLDGSISDAAARRIRNRAGITENDDPWERILVLEASQLLPVMENESIEVAAVLLSKLKVSKAAEILGMLPGQRARRITYAVSRTGAVSPETVTLIGRAIAKQLDTHDPRAFEEGPVDRVGAILNFAPSATREDVLVGLDETDGAFAEKVRKAIFTFANIPARVDARDIPKIMRDIDQAELVRAIAAAEGANEAAAEFILGNISQRMADNIREEVGEAGKVAPAEADAAMNSVVAVIRDLEAQGEIFLIAEDG